MATYSFD